MTKVEKFETETNSGLLIYHRYEDIGYDTQAIFLKDGTILGSRMDNRRLRSGIPHEYAGCMLLNVDWSRYGTENIVPQRNIINAFVTKFEEFQRTGRALYFYSNTKGTGKTMISCAIANEILKTHDVSVKFINVADYIELVKSKYDSDKENAKSILEAGLLILDDVGAQVENKEWITTALFRLIDKRYTSHCPTIFTSNVQMEQLKTDSRISDRIYAMSIPVMMPEINVRRQMSDNQTKKFLKSVLSED